MLYGAKNNFRTAKILIAANIGKSEVELAGENAPADKFPFGQVRFIEFTRLRTPFNTVMLMQ